MPSSDAGTMTPPSSRLRVGPARLFRIVSIAEAITWTLLLIGMFLKYVTDTTELGVTVFGRLHGAVFLAYGVTTVLVWIDQRWSARQGILGLLSAVPPFATLFFDRWVERNDMLDDAWRLRETAPRNIVEKLSSWVVRHPVVGGLVAVVLVGALFSFALVLGPPVGG